MQDDHPVVLAIRVNGDCRRLGWSLHTGLPSGGGKMVLVLAAGDRSRGRVGYEGVDFGAIENLARQNALMWQTEPGPRTPCVYTAHAGDGLAPSEGGPMP